MPLTDRKYSIGLAYASGTATRNGAAIDMSGFEEADIAVAFATIAAGATVSIKAQSDTTSAFASAQDIAGTAQVVAADDDGEVFVINISNPPERYVRVVVTKDGANACAESATYCQFDPHEKPTTQGTGVSSESFQWPANGDS